MKYIIILFAIMSFCSFEIQAQNNISKIKQLETEILEKAEDTKAVELIQMYMEAQLDFTKYKASIVENYDDELSQKERNRKFNLEHSKTEEVILLRTNIVETNKEKQEYLISEYQEYSKLLEERTLKLSPKRVKKQIDPKLKEQPIGSGN